MALQEAQVLTRALQEAHAQVEAARSCTNPRALARWLSPILEALRRGGDGKSACSAREFEDLLERAVSPVVEILFRRRWAEEDAVKLNRTFKETLAVCVSRLGDGFPNVWWLMCLLMGVDVGHKAMEYEEVETEQPYWDGSHTRTYARRTRHTATFYEQFGRPIRRPINGQSVFFYPDDPAPAADAGKALLGRRLAVVRRRGAGEVMGAACDYHAPSAEHLIAYEDGACEWVNLNRIRFRWIDRERWIPSNRALAQGPADVGLRVSVFWPKMRRSYTGFIRDWRDPEEGDGSRRGHRVVYDDGDDKWYVALSEREHRVLEREQTSVSRVVAEDPDMRLSFSAEDVGLRIRVFWPRMKTWYTGKVSAYHETPPVEGAKAGHTVLYDDGEERTYSDMRRRQYVLLRTMDLGEVRRMYSGDEEHREAERRLRFLCPVSDDDDALFTTAEEEEAAEVAPESNAPAEEATGDAPPAEGDPAAPASEEEGDADAPKAPPSKEDGGGNDGAPRSSDEPPPPLGPPLSHARPASRRTLDTSGGAGGDRPQVDAPAPAAPGDSARFVKRPHANADSPSLFLLENLEFVGRIGGWDALATALAPRDGGEQRAPGLVASQLAARCLAALRSILRPEVRRQCVQAVVEAVESAVPRATDAEIKATGPRGFPTLLRAMETLYLIVSPSRGTAAWRQELLDSEVALALLGCGQIGKRLDGMGALAKHAQTLAVGAAHLRDSDLAAAIRQSRLPDLRARLLLPRDHADHIAVGDVKTSALGCVLWRQWLARKRPVCLIFGDSIQAELVRYCGTLLRALLDADVLDGVDLDLIVRASIGGHEALARVAHDTLLDVVPSLSAGQRSRVFASVAALPFDAWTAPFLHFVEALSTHLIVEDAKDEQINPLGTSTDTATGAGAGAGGGPASAAPRRRVAAKWQRAYRQAADGDEGAEPGAVATGLAQTLARSGGGSSSGGAAPHVPPDGRSADAVDADQLRRMREEKYGVALLWQFLQDEAISAEGSAGAIHSDGKLVSEELTLSAVRALARLLALRQCSDELRQTADSCVQNLAAHHSVPQSLLLLRAIAKTLRTGDRMWRFGRGAPAGTMAGLLEALESKWGMLQLFFDDLHHYQQAISEHVAQVMGARALDAQGPGEDDETSSDDAASGGKGAGYAAHKSRVAPSTALSPAVKSRMGGGSMPLTRSPSTLEAQEEASTLAAAGGSLVPTPLRRNKPRRLRRFVPMLRRERSVHAPRPEGDGEDGGDARAHVPWGEAADGDAIAMPGCRITHERAVRARLAFLTFVLRASALSLDAQGKQVAVLWRSLVEGAVTQRSRDSALRWFAHARRPTSRGEVLSTRMVQVLFDLVLAWVDVAAPSLSIMAARVLLDLTLHINAARGKVLIYDKRSGGGVLAAGEEDDDEREGDDDDDDDGRSLAGASRTGPSLGLGGTARGASPAGGAGSARRGRSGTIDEDDEDQTPQHGLPSQSGAEASAGKVDADRALWDLGSLRLERNSASTLRGEQSLWLVATGAHRERVARLMVRALIALYTCFTPKVAPRVDEVQCRFIHVCLRHVRMSAQSLVLASGATPLAASVATSPRSGSPTEVGDSEDEMEEEEGDSGQREGTHGSGDAAAHATAAGWEYLPGDGAEEKPGAGREAEDGEGDVSAASSERARRRVALRRVKRSALLLRRLHARLCRPTRCQVTVVMERPAMGGGPASRRGSSAAPAQDEPWRDDPEVQSLSALFLGASSGDDRPSSSAGAGGNGAASGPGGAGATGGARTRLEAKTLWLAAETGAEELQDKVASAFGVPAPSIMLLQRVPLSEAAHSTTAALTMRAIARSSARALLSFDAARSVGEAEAPRWLPSALNPADPHCTVASLRARGDSRLVLHAVPIPVREELDCAAEHVAAAASEVLARAKQGADEEGVSLALALHAAPPLMRDAGLGVPPLPTPRPIHRALTSGHISGSLDRHSVGSAEGAVPGPPASSSNVGGRVGVEDEALATVEDLPSPGAGAPGTPAASAAPESHPVTEPAPLPIARALPAIAHEATQLRLWLRAAPALAWLRHGVERLPPGPLLPPRPDATLEPAGSGGEGSSGGGTPSAGSSAGADAAASPSGRGAGEGDRMTPEQARAHTLFARGAALAVTSATPGQGSSSNERPSSPDILHEQLFLLLTTEPAVAGAAWSVLQLLPTYSGELERLRTLEAGTQGQWGMLLPARQPHQLLYALQLVDGFLCSADADAEEEVMVGSDAVERVAAWRGKHASARGSLDLARQGVEGRTVSVGSAGSGGGGGGGGRRLRVPTPRFVTIGGESLGVRISRSRGSASSGGRAVHEAIALRERATAAAAVTWSRKFAQYGGVEHVASIVATIVQDLESGKLRSRRAFTGHAPGRRGAAHSGESVAASQRVRMLCLALALKVLHALLAVDPAFVAAPDAGVRVAATMDRGALIGSLDTHWLLELAMRAAVLAARAPRQSHAHGGTAATTSPGRGMRTFASWEQVAAHLARAAMRVVVGIALSSDSSLLRFLLLLLRGGGAGAAATAPRLEACGSADPAPRSSLSPGQVSLGVEVGGQGEDGRAEVASTSPAAPLPAPLCGWCEALLLRSRHTGVRLAAARALYRLARDAGLASVSGSDDAAGREEYGASAAGSGFSTGEAGGVDPSNDAHMRRCAREVASVLLSLLSDASGVGTCSRAAHSGPFWALCGSLIRLSCEREAGAGRPPSRANSNTSSEETGVAKAPHAATPHAGLGLDTEAAEAAPEDEVKGAPPPPGGDVALARKAGQLACVPSLGPGLCNEGPGFLAEGADWAWAARGVEALVDTACGCDARSVLELLWRRLQALPERESFHKESAPDPALAGLLTSLRYVLACEPALCEARSGRAVLWFVADRCLYPRINPPASDAPGTTAPASAPVAALCKNPASRACAGALLITVARLSPAGCALVLQSQQALMNADVPVGTGAGDSPCPGAAAAELLPPRPPPPPPGPGSHTDHGMAIGGPAFAGGPAPPPPPPQQLPLPRPFSTSASEERALAVSTRQRGAHAPTNRDWHDWSYDPNLLLRGNQPFVGLRNQGCTCYMNSLLQQLQHTPPFRDALLRVELPEPAPGVEEGDDQRVLFELQKLSAAMRVTQRQWVETLPFCRSFKDYDGSPVQLGEQKDVNEFAGMLFDKLERADQGAQEAVHTAYRGQLVNQIVSLESKHVSERQEPFYMLSVAVAGKPRLEESLDLFVAGETLSGDNKFMDPTLGRKADAMKRACVDELPDYLFLHLKRFEYDLMSGTKRKVNDYFEFPNDLDMEPYTRSGIARREMLAAQKAGRHVASAAEAARVAAGSEANTAEAIAADTPTPPSADGGESKGESEAAEAGGEGDGAGSGRASIPPRRTDLAYQLVGVVAHVGTADSGHYYSFIRERGPRGLGPWYEFNDKIVRPFDPARLPEECFGGSRGGTTAASAVRTNNAYMLLYQRVAATAPPAHALDTVRSEAESARAEHRQEARAEHEGETQRQARPPLSRALSDVLEEEEEGRGEGSEVGAAGGGEVASPGSGSAGEGTSEVEVVRGGSGEDEDEDEGGEGAEGDGTRLLDIGEDEEGGMEEDEEDEDEEDDDVDEDEDEEVDEEVDDEAEPGEDARSRSTGRSRASSRGAGAAGAEGAFAHDAEAEAPPMRGLRGPGSEGGVWEVGEAAGGGGEAGDRIAPRVATAVWRDDAGFLRDREMHSADHGALLWHVVCAALAHDRRAEGASARLPPQPVVGPELVAAADSRVADRGSSANAAGGGATSFAVTGFQHRPGILAAQVATQFAVEVLAHSRRRTALAMWLPLLRGAVHEDPEIAAWLVQTLASPCMWLHHMLAECPHRATRRGFLQLVVDSVQALRPYERSQYEDWVPVYAALGFAAEDGVVARTSGSFVAPADSYGDRVPLAAVPRLLDQALAFAARPPHAFLAATMRPPEPYELLTRLAGIGKEERAHLLRADAPYALMDFLTGSGGTLGSAAGGRQARAPRHMVGMPCLKEAARAAALLVRCCDWGVDEDERPSPLAVDGGQHPPSARVQDLMLLERVAECICADMGSSGLDILRHVCWGSMGNSDKLMVALSRRVDAGTSGSTLPEVRPLLTGLRAIALLDDEKEPRRTRNMVLILSNRLDRLAERMRAHDCALLQQASEILVALACRSKEARATLFGSHAPDWAAWPKLIKSSRHEYDLY